MGLNYNRFGYQYFFVITGNTIRQYNVEGIIGQSLFVDTPRDIQFDKCDQPRQIKDMKRSRRNVHDSISVEKDIWVQNEYTES